MQWAEDYAYLLDEDEEGPPTGTHTAAQGYKMIVYPFERYEITVKLTPDGKFVGIEQVAVNKDFRSFKQRLASTAFHDVEEYYQD